MDDSTQNPLLHIMLFGFHHKIGYQTEFCYPPLNPKNSLDLPQAWKHLPCVALPDGAHEFVQNCVYFVLPSVTEKDVTVFGVACHRQEIVENLKLQSSTEVTRSSVMKSIAILMRKPLFGCLRRRLETLTSTFFEEGSLADYGLLQDAYHQFSQSLASPPALEESQDDFSLYYIDLSLRSLLLHHKHNVLILLKVLLLEKKVMYLESGSILNIANQLLALVSLLPGVLHEDALKHCAIVDPELHLTQLPPPPTLTTIPTAAQLSRTNSVLGDTSGTASGGMTETKRGTFGSSRSLNAEANNSSTGSGPVTSRFSSAWQAFSSGAQATGSFLKSKMSGSNTNSGNTGDPDVGVASSTSSLSMSANTGTVSASEVTQSEDLVEYPDVAALPFNDWAFPLHLFGKNCLFLPYVSLYEKDIISNPAVYSFHIGCNNATFKSSRDHVNAIIGADPTHYIMDSELRKQSQLSSADLRFMDFLLSVIQSTKTQEGKEESPSPSTTPRRGSPTTRESEVDASTDSKVTDGVPSTANQSSPSKSQPRASINNMITKNRKALSSNSARFPSISSESELAAWEGSDDWIREHFRIYLQSLLLAAAGDYSSASDYNSSFIAALRRTHHYQRWLNENRILPLLQQVTSSATAGSASKEVVTSVDSVDAAGAGQEKFERAPPWEHPFHKSWQVDDLRLRMNHLLSNTAQGRRLNTVVQNTGKLVSGTGKVVYGAALQSMMSAKSAVSNFWTSVQQPQ